MFDFAWSEVALIGIVGLLFIGPKDMPVAIRTVTNLLKKGRKLAGEFQTHVDEMVREADLGEARDQFRQLRSMNVRGQIMKALDEDGSIKRTLTTDPLAPSGPEMKPFEGSAARPVLARAVTQGWQPPAPPPGMPLPQEDAAAAAADPAPSILPPAVARRLRVERARPLPPRFVPPRTARRDNGPGAGQPPARHVDATPLPWQMPPAGVSPDPERSYPVDAGIS